MKPLLATCALFLASCTCPLLTKHSTGVLYVDYSARRATLGTRTFPVTVSKKGVGGRPGSNKTPIGTFTICQKTTRHRFGPILRLSGESVDGYRQDGRGVLVHKQFGSSTRGCIGFAPIDLNYVYQHLDEGDVIKISM